MYLSIILAGLMAVMVIGLIVGAFALLITSHKRARRNLALPLTQPPGPALRDPNGWWWHARVGPTTLLNTLTYGLASRRGTLRLEAGTLSFIQLSQTEPQWSVPVSELGIKRIVAGIGLVQNIQLEAPAFGRIGLEVSREPMAIWDENTFAELRQVSYADDFMARILAAGARPLN